MEKDRNNKKTIKIEKGILNTSNIKQLQIIENSPKEIFYKGNIDLLNKGIIAVVGSRKPSKYAKNMCNIFVKKLIENGFVIASGLAVGIDGLAHTTCIENGGKTIAVLAGGIDEIYPEENVQLAQSILETEGLIISEENFDTETNNKNFPIRNRIISGISMAVLVIESAYRSGSNITARYAKKQNKKLFAIPYNIGTKGIGGMRRLLELNAKLVYDPEQMINEIGNIENKVKIDNMQKENFNKIKKQKLEDDLFEIYKLLSNKPIDVNYIARMTKKKIQNINYSLVDLELRGYITKLPGNKYVINNE